MSGAVGATQRRRTPQVAELVAGELRNRILDGELADGDRLPRQEDLLEEFGVSKPSLREALRILETEGLVTVRRGKVGGAVVHRPTTDSAAYAINMVLRSNEVSIQDVVRALNVIEPQCVALCSLRSDRETTIVARLRELQTGALEAIEDAPEFAKLGRRFHEEIVDHCGNQTLILLIGALESIRSEAAAEWMADNEPSLAMRQQSHADHDQIVELISSGDAEAAAKELRRHLTWSPVEVQLGAEPRP
jgi:GntR family transcriptional repressor for pyruvate dehydrogenase complex